VLFPDSTADVQAIVAAANQHGVPLYPISTGNNIGLGSRAPIASGQVVVDLGFRMNRILEVNEETCYAVLEPGVSFQMLHDELARRGDKLMISATSGPPHGGVIGNALDRGAGYGPTSTTSACYAAWRSCWATASSYAPAMAAWTPATG
jgi:4-cresol dehydrogenase (hydroxylating)